MKPVERLGAWFRIEMNEAITPDAETSPPACTHNGCCENDVSVTRKDTDDMPIIRVKVSITNTSPDDWSESHSQGNGSYTITMAFSH